jgi:phosphoribosylformylglycinamidine synthase
MKSAIVVFPGTNRDRDMRLALERAAGARPALVWHGETALPDVDLIVLPGGFSYGDYLRSGAMAAHSPILREVKAHAERGARVLAVCNGFQIAAESGLLPGALMRNANLKFLCKDVHLAVGTARSDFTRALRPGEVIQVPVAHHDGCYVADDATLDRLEQEDRVAFRYCDETGRVADDTTLNGSRRNIAGILNERRNVLGMMPHPEDAVDPVAGGLGGAGLFQSLVEALS